MHSYLNDRKLSHGVGRDQVLIGALLLTGHIQKSVYHKCSAVKVKFFVVLSITYSPMNDN